MGAFRSLQHARIAVRIAFLNISRGKWHRRRCYRILDIYLNQKLLPFHFGGKTYDNIENEIVSSLFI